MNSKDRQLVNSEVNKSFWEINQQPLKEMLTFVDFADDKLNIAFAEINFAQDRDLIIEKLIQHPTCNQIQFELLNFSNPDLRFLRDELVKALSEIKLALDKKLVLLVTGLEKSIGIVDEYPPVLVDLNYVRDDFRRSICHPIIFLLPDYALTRLAKYAPDFWAWGRKVFYFKSIKSNLEITRDSTLFVDNSRSLALPVKQSRIDLLHRLLSEYLANNRIENKSKTINSLYNQLGIAYYDLGEYQQAIDCWQNSLKISQKIADRHGESNSLNNLGSIYDSLGEYPRAIEYYQQSLAIQQQIGDRHGEAASLNNLGSIYDSLGEYPRAIEYYQQSLAIKQQIGDRHGESKSLNNLGIAYKSLGEYPRAIDYHQQSLAIKQQIGDRRGEAASLNNLGNAYNSLGEYPRAIEYYQQSLAIKQQIGDRHGESNSLGNLGNAYDSLGEYPRAIEYYQQSLAIQQQIGDRRGEADTWFNLGNTYKKLQQKSEAKAVLESARKLYQKMELEQDVEDCNQAIQELDNQTK